MPSILVTGAAGLVGQRLVRALEPRGEVFGLCREPPDEPGSSVNWIAADLTDPLFPEKLPATLDTVIHLAQSSRFRSLPDQAMDVFAVNVDSTARLLDWSSRNGVRRFILASTGGVYGSGPKSFSESEPLGGNGPLGYYPASKRCAELLTESYAGNFDVAILRFFFIYGTEQRQSMLIPRLVDSVATRRAITLQGSDGLTINPLHVDDAVLAIMRVLELTGSHTINIAGPQPLTLRQIGDAIGRAFGTDPVYDVQEDVEPGSLVGDIGKMTRLLGAPQVPFSEGIAEICAGYGVNSD